MGIFAENFAWDGFDGATAGWFARRLGRPTAVQARAWPQIQAGHNVLIAAPTGSGKTLAAFLAVIDALVRQGSRRGLPVESRVLYVSPLKALSNDIHRNLEAPLQGIADALLESGRAPVEIRAGVRTGDTPQRERERMRRKPPHILVTTPESLFILLGSESGREMLRGIGSVIVDEIHALAANKRGAHLALSLARLQALVGAPLQKIGLSATQKPVEDVARFLCGEEDCAIIDAGHNRARDLALEIPASPLTAVMAGEVWAEIYDRLAGLAREHKTTLVFVNTRRLAERVTRHLAERLSEDEVAAHHGSLAKEHRLDAEQRLKGGKLRVLVATASMELGIDIGDVDLVCQLGSPRGISVFLQRVGRSGHAVDGTPKGRLFPTTLDEAVECAALLQAVAEGELDRLVPAHGALDVLAQHVVAEVAARDWGQQELLDCLRQAWPYRQLDTARYEAVLLMLAEGYSSRRGRRGAYLHWDRVNGQLRGRRGARLVGLTNAGVIPDQFDYDVILLPDGFRIGTLNEDFAFETLPGDIFQLGNQSYRVVRPENGRLLVEDARGQPPTVPFWLGEAPGRSDELSLAVSRLRAEVGDAVEQGVDAAIALLRDRYALDPALGRQLVEYLAAGKLALGAMPTRDTIVLERFFDDTGDMHLVVHSCFGSRINKAWGLALRKRFCRKFNFELQAAALEDSIVLSLGVTHSFPLAEVAAYLKSANVRDVLEQALLDAPMFPMHWRWNATTALAVRRHLGNRKSPPAWQRNDAEDLMAVVFPDQIACAENLSGKREIPDHPLVAQTLRDCLYEVMDLPGLLAVLQKLEQGRIRVVCAELTAPSVLAQEIINARPYAFLDDGDAENRRTMAISQGEPQGLDDARALRELSAEVIAQIRQQAWPRPGNADEVHDALVVHGLFRAEEVEPWLPWLEELAAQRRACRLNLPHGGTIWTCAERLALLQQLLPAARVQPAIDALPAAPGLSPLVEVIRGRLECLGPVSAAALAASLQLDVAQVEVALTALESEGFVVRGAFENQGEQWCERRLLARIHRLSRQGKRARIRPVSPRSYQRFLLSWQGLGGERPEGEEALLQAMDRLEGYCAPAAVWEQHILPARLALYMPGQLDALCAAGKLSWARILPPAGRRSGRPFRHTPIAFAPREALGLWRQLGGGPAEPERAGNDARLIMELLQHSGAAFFSDIVNATGLLRAQVESGLGELVALGLVNADTFAGLRGLLIPSRGRPRNAPRTRRHRALFSGVQDAGRWSVLPPVGEGVEAGLEHYLWAVLARYGVIARCLLEVEAIRPPWRDLLRLAWRLEARGEIQGGRFIDGIVGEQFALPEAARALQQAASAGNNGELIALSAADPAHVTGQVLPGAETIAARGNNRVLYRDGELVAWLEAGEIGMRGSNAAEQGQWLAALTGSAPRPRRRG